MAEQNKIVFTRNQPWADELTPEEWRMFLKWYRDIRIAMWDPRGKGEVQAYGMSRPMAREWLYKIIRHLCWMRYLGSK